MPGNSTASLSYLSKTYRSSPGTRDPHHWQVSTLFKSREIRGVLDSSLTFSNRYSWHKISLFQSPRQGWGKAEWADVILGTIHPPWWCAVGSSLCPGWQRCPHPIRKKACGQGGLIQFFILRWISSCFFGVFSPWWAIAASPNPWGVSFQTQFLPHGTWASG